MFLLVRNRFSMISVFFVTHAKWVSGYGNMSRLRYVFPAASVAPDALRHTQSVRRKPLGQCIPTRLFCLERPMRLTQRVRRGLQIDARLFLNIDAVACGYLRCESTECVSLYNKHAGNIK